jgi:hypothetical protein
MAGWRQRGNLFEQFPNSSDKRQQDIRKRYATKEDFKR